MLAGGMRKNSILAAPCSAVSFLSAIRCMAEGSRFENIPLNIFSVSLQAKDLITAIIVTQEGRSRRYKALLGFTHRWPKKRGHPLFVKSRLSSFKF
jgi:hypothetical protein